MLKHTNQVANRSSHKQTAAEHRAYKKRYLKKRTINIEQTLLSIILFTLSFFASSEPLSSVKPSVFKNDQDFLLMVSDSTLQETQYKSDFVGPRENSDVTDNSRWHENWFLTGQFGTLAEIQYDETDQNLSDVIGNKVKDSLPWNLGVGYQWNDWLATKAEYWSFSTARGVTSISSDDLKSAVQQLILRNTALVGMSIHSSIPLNSKVTLDLEAGHYEWQSNVFINYGTQDPLTGAQLRGTALRYGAGFSYLARPNLKLNLMFNEFQIHQLTQSTIMLGLSYRFGDTSSQPIYNKQTSKITALNADMVMQLPKAEIDSTLDSNAIRFASDSIDIAETDIERLRRLLSSVPLGRLVNIELKAYAQKHAINHYEKVLSHVRMVAIKSVIESFYPDTVPVVTRQYHINSTTDVSTGGRVEVILNLLPE